MRITVEYYPNSNKVTQFTYQLQNTAAQMVQKQIVVISFFKFWVCNMSIHACILSQCSYELIYSLLYYS